MSCVSVHDQSAPPSTTSANACEVGQRMPPRLMPTVGRSSAPSSQTMLKKSYDISDGEHQPPAATRISGLAAAVITALNSASDESGLSVYLCSRKRDAIGMRGASIP